MEEIYKNTLRVEIELNNVCNLNCPLCSRNTIYTKDDFKQKIHVDSDKLISLLNQFPNLKYVTLAGEYSEPTTYPDLFKVLDYLHNRDIEVYLFINASTKNDTYYKILAKKFLGTKSTIYFSLFGTTNKLHTKYRKGGNLEDTLRRAKIIKSICPNNFTIIWILFKYNIEDYLQNKNFLKKYCNSEEIFWSIPFAERYNLSDSLEKGICLPEEERNIYNKLDKNPDYKNMTCKSIKNNFAYIDNNLNIWPCSLSKHNKCSFEEIKKGSKSFCFECFPKNLDIMYDYKIHTLCESETMESNHKLRK
jgi:MoaA/NifB/PqqE/SkfB family radical SAM enzyme